MRAWIGDDWPRGSRDTTCMAHVVRTLDRAMHIVMPGGTTPGPQATVQAGGAGRCGGAGLPVRCILAFVVPLLGAACVCGEGSGDGVAADAAGVGSSSGADGGRAPGGPDGPSGGAGARDPHVIEGVALVPRETRTEGPRLRRGMYSHAMHLVDPTDYEIRAPGRGQAPGDAPAPPSSYPGEEPVKPLPGAVVWVGNPVGATGVDAVTFRERQHLVYGDLDEGRCRVALAARCGYRVPDRWWRCLPNVPHKSNTAPVVDICADGIRPSVQFVDAEFDSFLVAGRGGDGGWYYIPLDSCVTLAFGTDAWIGMPPHGSTTDVWDPDGDPLATLLHCRGDEARGLWTILESRTILATGCVTTDVGGRFRLPNSGPFTSDRQPAVLYFWHPTAGWATAVVRLDSDGETQVRLVLRPGPESPIRPGLRRVIDDPRFCRD